MSECGKQLGFCILYDRICFFFVSEMCSDCPWDLLQFTNKPQKSKTRMKHKCLKSARVERGEIHFIMCIIVSKCGWVHAMIWFILSSCGWMHFIIYFILSKHLHYQSNLDVFIISQCFWKCMRICRTALTCFFQNLYYCFSGTPLWQLHLCEFNFL